MKNFIGKCSMALGLYAGWGSVSITVEEADAISSRFDIDFSMNSAHAEVVLVGWECFSFYSPAAEVLDDCGNVIFEQESEVTQQCDPVYVWYDDSSEPCSVYGSCDDSSTPTPAPAPAPGQCDD